MIYRIIGYYDDDDFGCPNLKVKCKKCHKLMKIDELYQHKCITKRLIEFFAKSFKDQNSTILTLNSKIE